MNIFADDLLLNEFTDDETDEPIEHHGIFGMKWGVRRYQNRDGSLTEAGKRRYNRQINKFERQYRRMKRAGKELKRTRIIGSNRKLLPAIIDRQQAREEYDEKLDRANDTISEILNEYGKDYVSEMSPEIIAKGKAVSIRVMIRKMND